MAEDYDLDVRPAGRSEFGDRYFVVLLFNASRVVKHTHGNKKGELNPPGD